MPKIHFDLNSAGVKELLLSQELGSVVSGYAEQVAGRAGSMTGLEYESTARAGKGRVKATVRAGSAHAYYENLKNNTLLKALEG